MTGTATELTRAAPPGADPPVPGSSARAPTAWRSAAVRWGPLLLLGLAAVVVVLVAHAVLLPTYSWNRDEPVYLWQVEGLRDGFATAPDGGAPEHVRPWLSAARDGRLFSQYTLGWPLVLLAADVVLGTPAAALALAGLLAVLGTYALARELTDDRPLALVAGALMVASPILAVQGGAYLSYLFTLGIGLWFSVAALSGLRLASRTRLVAAGLLLGWVFLTRPFDAFLWGGVVAAFVLLRQRGRWRSLLGPAAWVALGVLPLLAVTLAYNAAVAGGPLTFPISAKDPLDTFGFGRRRIMPAFRAIDYTVRHAFIGSAKNAAWAALFLVGGFVGAVAAVVGLWLRRRHPATPFLVLLGLAFPVGYFFFWGTNVSSLTSSLSGPIYSVPVYAPLTILIAGAVVATWRHRRRLGVVLLAALALGTVPVAVDALVVNRELSDTNAPWRGSTDGIEGDALVVVADSGPYLLFTNPYAVNPFDLEGPLLYAADRGPSNLELIADHPDRAPYRQQSSIPHALLLPRDGVQVRVPDVWVTPLEVRRGPSLTLRGRVANPDGARSVVVTLRAGGFVEQRTLSTDAGPGDTFEVAWELVPPGGEARSGATAAALDVAAGQVSVSVGYGDTAREARASTAARAKVPYRVDGGGLEAVVPVEYDRRGREPGREDYRYWFPSQALEELDVEVVATP